MRTLLIILGIWLLINVLFVVVMIPPRKPRRANVAGRSGDATPVAAGMHSGTTETQDESVSLRHVVIAIALGVFFSLTPPLLEAYDAIKGLVSKRLLGSKESPGAPDGDAQADKG
ncbi:hypothetical protein [Bradyrhizobium iriomotense]|uniref:hypothetical protein n=1 Tax=Bradyrhizobium iriomotense TaxID=441950 RepID=UPI001B8A0CB4|nr:hypothetical protein [Bradyrhizobium iriomotense]MBR0786874.1 hypothetical protein [Bradyrhizobium iriomotense]